jgi:uncharacterized protein YfdQ (DUF2303 family)
MTNPNFSLISSLHLVGVTLRSLHGDHDSTLTVIPHSSHLAPRVSLSLSVCSNSKKKNRVIWVVLTQHDSLAKQVKCVMSGFPAHKCVVFGFHV